MAYVINKTNGDTLMVLQDGTLDTTVSNSNGQGLNLVGKNYVGYGELQQENFVRLLENFASNSQPTSPLRGQLWYDTGANSLKYYDGVKFRSVNRSTVANVLPSSISNVSSLAGDTWWNTDTEQFSVYTGTEWVTVGPAFKKEYGLSGAAVEAVYDVPGQEHIVIKFYSKSTLIGIVSPDAEFTPNVAIPGFSTVKPGINLSTAIDGNKLHSTATNAENLGNIPSSSYLRNDVGGTIAGSLTLESSLSVHDGRLHITADAAQTKIVNPAYTKDLIITSNVNGVETPSLTINGTTGRVSVVSDPTTNLGIATKQYVDTNVDNLSDAVDNELLNLRSAVNTSITANVATINQRLDSVDDSIAQLDELKANSIGPVLTSPLLQNAVLAGTTQAPTPPIGDSSTKIATTAFVAGVAGGVIPVGAIVMWSGTNQNIPYGWEICDGRVVNGITLPDLRDRFIVGVGSQYQVRDTGGTASVTLNVNQIPSHTHTASTSDAGAHTHTGTAFDAGNHTHPYVDTYFSEHWGPDKSLGNSLMGSAHSDSDNALYTMNRVTSAGGAHSHPISIESAGTHGHSVSVQATGGSGAHENRPPYYALFFIMKVI